MSTGGVKSLDIPKENVQAAFTPWVRWVDRYTLGTPSRDVVDKRGRPYALHEYGGVYLLAHFRAGYVPRSVDVLDEGIVYVGETTRFASRWRYFERAASADDGRGHSGGISYRSTHGVGIRRALHVSALPTWFPAEEHDDAPETARSPSRRLRMRIEAELLWQLSRSRAASDWLLNRK